MKDRFWITKLTYCLCVAGWLAMHGVGGCALPPKDDAPPLPTPDASSLDGAAEKAVYDFANGRADLAEAVAADLDAGKFQALSQVYDEYKAGDDDLRKKVNAALGLRFDQDVPPGQAMDAAAVSKAYRLMAAGFRRGGK